ncbi:LOW QUALITY PROTEIN: hypothetical protein TorRG33x02_141400 [Trema orientale]|uniref:Uncharacterized protein n=1 Tax=Trema orientale TaxID=63057 RepID=A0A2P5EX42_TREOI|nr:LOW QUALITY PROTEIN: hypothetical protein TorRG33x02_141400 [Trema orientale]
MLIPEFLPIPGRFLHIFSKFHFLFLSLTLLLLTLKKKKKTLKTKTTKGKQNKTGLSSTTPESFRTIRKESEQSKTRQDKPMYLNSSKDVEFWFSPKAAQNHDSRNIWSVGK